MISSPSWIVLPDAASFSPPTRPRPRSRLLLLLFLLLFLLASSVGLALRPRWHLNLAQRTAFCNAPQVGASTAGSYSATDLVDMQLTTWFSHAS